MYLTVPGGPSLQQAHASRETTLVVSNTKDQFGQFLNFISMELHFVSSLFCSTLFGYPYTLCIVIICHVLLLSSTLLYELYDNYLSILSPKNIWIVHGLEILQTVLLLRPPKLTRH